ncbi:hypothetical protein AYO44_05785 [Planctomycetaceae bacterium SCGC AG-212-F19]|nr:hypothetical protein AYO44_05785 [Planctomycetaceae bacterium SCGC AG-212-F19]
MRQGALTVLATQVPISVYKNATLMVRFLVYIAESILKRESYRTIAEVWHHTAATNAINAILDYSDEVKEWAFREINGLAPIQDFMISKSQGRLRRGHVYEDSASVLLEMATPDGPHQQLRRITEHNSYAPETFCYFLLGWPERIHLNDPVIQECARAHSQVVHNE